MTASDYAAGDRPSEDTSDNRVSVDRTSDDRASDDRMKDDRVTVDRDGDGPSRHRRRWTTIVLEPSDDGWRATQTGVDVEGRGATAADAAAAYCRRVSESSAESGAVGGGSDGTGDGVDGSAEAGGSSRWGECDG